MLVSKKMSIRTQRARCPLKFLSSHYGKNLYLGTAVPK